MRFLTCVSRLVTACVVAGWLILPAFSAESAPVTPDASPEARALLKLLYDVSGHHTFTGQHNYPNVKARNSEFAARVLGKTPVIFGTDMGFAKPGDTDSYLARPDIVQTCIREHQQGSIIALCWHAVPPTADEPITFRPQPGADPNQLHSVQGKLLDAQFRDVLTPGTALHRKWEEQVDVIAGFLQQLQAAHVPVLWRPYHEMNGDWFWWGNRGADTAALYRQMFDRFVHHHHLNNLIWVWSVDRVSKPGFEHEKVFPGIEYVDVLALDVYGNDFARSYLDSLVRLSQGKPLALAEVGNPPSPEILAQQPRWTYYMTWAGMVRNTSPSTYARLFADPRIVNRNDAAYAEITSGYRRACGLPVLVNDANQTDFSGHWVINEDQSTFGRGGAANAPAELNVRQSGRELRILSTRIVEYADNETTEQTLTIDGPAVKSEFMSSPRETRVRRGADGAVVFETVLSPTWAPGTKMTTNETWKLSGDRRELVITTEDASPAGPQRSTLVFERRP